MKKKKKNYLILKKLNSKNINIEYLKWMNDKEVTKFTEQRFKKHSLLDIKNFVREKNKSKNEFLYGIFIKKKSILKHVGNIKLGPINKIHKSAEISYIIGNRNFWKMGIGTDAVKAIVKIAKKKFKLKKLVAGCYENNLGSIKVLKNNNFKQEAKFISQILYSSKRINMIVYGLII